ncbi:MAG: uroporphyrinogen decarboxylase family protein [Thermodesulfobacteriota bacterium]
MNKIEILQATLSGKPVGRPPFSIWYHFGTQHASPERTAQVHLEFFDAYDLDLLKVMNDYDYPMPAGLESIETPEDLRQIKYLDIFQTPMGKQLRTIEIIAAALKGKAFFFDTVFNAWNTLRRSLAKEFMPILMEKYSDPLLEALSVVNRNLIQYALASLRLGSSGIFLSVPASADFLTREQYEKFMRPFDVEFLKAIAEDGKINILHAHGEKLYLDRLLDYPVQILSWADLNGGPSIAEARKLTSLTLMAGIDHVRFPYLSIKALRQQVKSAISQAGNTKFILAGGCALPTYSFSSLIRATRDAARKPFSTS